VRKEGTEHPARRSTISFVVAVVLVVVLVAGAQSAPGRSVLRTAGLMGSPERYSELYFAHPDQLERRVPASGAPLRMEFTVRNREGSARVYHWHLSAGPKPGRNPGGLSGTLSLAAGRSATIVRRLVPPCRGARDRLSVRISDTEAIGYWISCRQPAGKQANG
jgi:hypothetical protein